MRGMLAGLMRVALGQINTTIGAHASNAAKVVEWAARAGDRGAEIVLFPELTLNGYPPGDLIEVSDFVAEGEETLHELALKLKGGPIAVVGFVEACPHATGLGRSNSVAWIEGGAVRVVGRKSLLPNYDVFDERRYFDPADARTLIERGRVKLGLSICEDLWNDERFWPRRLYETDPIGELRGRGASWVLNASASPFEIGKPKLRRAMISAAAQHHAVGVVYCNLVGGNDSLVFDGHSMVVDPAGSLLAHARGFEEELLVVDLPEAASTGHVHATDVPAENEQELVLQALVLGLRDYMRKTGFERAVIGLSGGVDSALVAVLAARALGAANVLGVAMPSRFTSSMSDEDAATLARRLGIGFEVIPIEPVADVLRTALSPRARRRPPRCRRREPAGARARDAADGDLEQARTSAAHDRQQERALGRLLHALRRHGGRPRADRRRAEDDGVEARRAREPRRRNHPAPHDRPARRPPSCARTRRTRTRCRRIPSSTACCRISSSSASACASRSRAAPPSPSFATSAASFSPPSTSASRRRRC